MTVIVSYRVYVGKVTSWLTQIALNAQMKTRDSRYTCFARNMFVEDRRHEGRIEPSRSLSYEARIKLQRSNHRIGRVSRCRYT